MWRAGNLNSVEDVQEKKSLSKAQKGKKTNSMEYWKTRKPALKKKNAKSSKKRYPRSIVFSRAQPQYHSRGVDIALVGN
jgi:hypothetical protein